MGVTFLVGALAWIAGCVFTAFCAKRGFLIKVPQLTVSDHGHETVRWKERIVCPECEEQFDGQVEWRAGMSFPLYAAECPNCHRMIMESEWQPADRQWGATS